MGLNLEWAAFSHTSRSASWAVAIVAINFAFLADVKVIVATRVTHYIQDLWAAGVSRACTYALRNQNNPSVLRFNLLNERST